MIWFLRTYQVDIMLALASICTIIAVFTALAKTIPIRRKRILLIMEISSSIWLFADRVAYLYHGVAGKTGHIAVVVSNFLVFLMTIFVLESINLYMQDVLINEGGMKKIPFPLHISDILAVIAAVLVVVSQFTGLYYTFDASNTYQRSKLYFISFIFPYAILVIMLVELLLCRKHLKGKVALSLYLFIIGCVSSSLIQLFIYGISWMDMMAVLLVIMVYLFSYLDLNERVDTANKIAINHLKNEQESLRHLFEQTAGVLAEAIDAKDPRTDGRSARVAGYSREIARVAGYDEKECDRIYYTALLHDVGKIKLPDTLVSRENELDDEESVTLKKHPEIGVELLSGITEYPFLKEGARSHHERFDGQGYPEGLKGEAIPVAARVVALADFYDSMASKSLFIDALPQRTVREEILKGRETQFDPALVDALVELIDADTEYNMRETDKDSDVQNETDITTGEDMHFAEYKETVSDGIKISENVSRYRFSVRTDKDADEKRAVPAMILFDSYDSCTHSDDRSIRALNYLEYAEIWFDGHAVSNAARNLEISVTDLADEAAVSEEGEGVRIYEVETSRYDDHLKVTITGVGKAVTAVVALPDPARFAYMGITGENCSIRCTGVQETGVQTAPGDIPRIAGEVSFIDRIEGDIPNVQILGYRAAWTTPVPLSDGMRLRFHTMSLPTANLIWHCPFILLYSSDDKNPLGAGYRELACIRLDGENATYNGVAHNETTATRGEDFKTWDDWKKDNLRGYECEVNFRRRGKKILLATENCGIKLKNTTTVTDKTENIYVVVTGDQCAITDIRIGR